MINYKVTYKNSTGITGDVVTVDEGWQGVEYYDNLQEAEDVAMEMHLAHYVNGCKYFVEVV